MNDFGRPKLLWSKRLDAAVAYAGELHRNQTRKGSRAPYVAHLLDTASLALKHDGTEDEAIAALLHDALEDCDVPARIRREVRRRFGQRVLDIVEACTATTARPKPDWLTRKTAYVATIAAKSQPAKFVSACDKAANLGDMIEDFRRVGRRLWNRFNADRNQVLWYYKSCAREFAKGKTSRKLRAVLPILRRRVRDLREMSED